MKPFQRSFQICLGTVGREEKIARPEFLDVVVSVVRAVPGSGFLWTGRTQPKELVEALSGIPNKWVGWVNVYDFIPFLDVYMETIPQGGLSTLVAWQLGIPAVGLDNVHSPYGSVDYDGIASAKTVEQYREMVLELCQSQGARNRVVTAQKLALEAEQSRAEEDVRAWWELVRG